MPTNYQRLANTDTSPQNLFENPFQIESDDEEQGATVSYPLQNTTQQQGSAADNEAGSSSNTARYRDPSSSSSTSTRIPMNQVSIRQKLINTINRITSNTPGRRLLNLVLPNYVSVAYEPANVYRGRVIGNGLQNDGVFSNMMAKPTVEDQSSSDIPPTYEEASADATPAYWDASVFLPYDDVLVDGLPVGNIINFIWNLMVSSAFSFIGFLLTYLLHTSHAAKEGSRAGLGVTFISYGYYMIPENSLLNPFQSNNKNNEDSQQNFPDGMFEPTDPNNFDIDSSQYLEGTVGDFHSSLGGVVSDDFESQNKDGTADDTFDENSAPILAYCIVAFGVFMIVKSLIDYQRAKQMERTILQGPNMEEV